MRSVTNHVCQLHFSVCTQIKVDSSNGVAWNDIHNELSPFHKSAFSINLLNSLKHWNVKYAIKVKTLDLYDGLTIGKLIKYVQDKK